MLATEQAEQLAREGYRTKLVQYATKRLRQKDLAAAFQRWSEEAEHRGSVIYKAKGMMRRWQQRQFGDAFKQWRAVAECLAEQAYKGNKLERQRE